MDLIKKIVPGDFSKKLNEPHFLVMAPSHKFCGYTDKAIRMLDNNGLHVVVWKSNRIRDNMSIPPHRLHRQMKRHQTKSRIRKSGLPTSLPHTWPRIFEYNPRTNEYIWVGGASDLVSHLKRKLGILREDLSSMECSGGCLDE